MRYDVIVYTETTKPYGGLIVADDDDFDNIEYIANCIQDVLQTHGHHGYLVIESRDGETMDEYDF